MGSFAEEFEELIGTPPLSRKNDKLTYYWRRPVSELASLNEPEIPSSATERHRIYSLMLMALVEHYWNGYKKGRTGTYPWIEPPQAGAAPDYYGHNIAAIAVDRRGRVIDFDFNHNKLFNSSAEHAEARLVRRVFGLAQIADASEAVSLEGPKVGQPETDYTMLSEVTIYTSLESCAQCAGVMALGRVKEVVYLQTDPGMYLIGRLLRNLTDEKLRAPRPIPGSEVGLSFFAELDGAFQDFADRVADEPFWSNGAKDDRDPSVTSYLCTDLARSVYRRGACAFAVLADGRELEYPDARPTDRDGKVIEGGLSNREAVAEAAQFLSYAVSSGRRGTTHRA